MSFLLDTNVVNELRKSRTRIKPRVAAWAAPLDMERQFLSATTVFDG